MVLRCLSVGFCFPCRALCSQSKGKHSATRANHTHIHWAEHFLDAGQLYFLSRTMEHFLLSKKPRIKREKTTVNKNTSCGAKEKADRSMIEERPTAQTWALQSFHSEDGYILIPLYCTVLVAMSTTHWKTKTPS